jgi:Na+/H+ antiporter NhaC
MSFVLSFLPVFVFIGLYVGVGLISPVVAVLPALIVGFLLQTGSTKERIALFLNGICQKDIITMCMVFLLAGAFSEITKSIGSVDATVSMTLSFMPSHFLLIGIFIASALIATAIGTSMGTIATMAPLAVHLASQGTFSAALGVATVVSGAMFGDNISIISDTTIAAVASQGADFRKKLQLNGTIAFFASLITILILYMVHKQETIIGPTAFSPILITPYILLIMLAVCGFDVFVVLTVSILFAGIVGMACGNYSLAQYNRDIVRGFESMYDIMLLSLLVGGLAGFMHHGIAAVIQTIRTTGRHTMGSRGAQYTIAALASVFDILLANNTIAIIFSGEIAKDIAHTYKVPKHYSAAWLDIFSCVFQGIIPYGAQILLASSIAAISPLAIVGKVYYCYVLAIVAVIYITIMPNPVDI